MKMIMMKKFPVTFNEKILYKENNTELDYYESSYNTYNRLKEEYDKNNRIIVAVDFDSTIKPYQDGESTAHVIDLLKRLKPYAFIYIFTARTEKSQDEIVDYCGEHGIEFENINVGCEDGRKPFYHILLDDRAGLGECIKMLEQLISEIEDEE